MTDAATATAATCATCAHLRAEARQCGLRGLAVADPTHTACASHPAHGHLRRPFAIGPVVHAAQPDDEVLQAAPDDARTRERLLDLIGAIDVHGTAPLSPREAIVVAQLRSSGEPRAFHHLDRIDAAMTINRARSAGRLTSPGGFFRALAHAAGVTDAELARQSARPPGEFLLQFTLPGRLVLLAAVVLGAAVFGGTMLLDVVVAGWLGTDSVALHLGLAVLLGAIAAAVVIRLGRRILERAGVPFRTEPADRDPSGPTMPGSH